MKYRAGLDTKDSYGISFKKEVALERYSVLLNINIKDI
jgi:hypothetical protein